MMTERTSSQSNTSWSSGNGFWNCVLIVFVAGTLLLVDFSVEANATKKRRGGSSQSRQISAAKSRMTSMIQQQIDAAKKVLVAVESKAAMSQTEVNQALSDLSAIQGEIESSELEVRETTKALKAIEDEIVAKQQPKSEMARAQATLEQAKDESHLAIHRLLDLPPDKEEQTSGTARLTDLANLSDAQRAILNADASYQAAQQNLRDAGQKVDQVRRKLFQADRDWVAAQEDLSEALQKLREERQQAKAAGASSTKNKQGLQDAQSVAASARAVIAQGEARLRLLSKMPSGRSGSPRTGK